MMKKRIRIFTFFLTLLLTLLSAIPSVASESGRYKGDSGYEVLITDEADLLSEQEEKELLEQMKPLLEYGHAVFQTVDLTSSDYEGYAESSYYDYYGNEPGVLLQIDMGNRKITLCASTEMEKEIGKERDSIVDNIYEYASDGDYLSCAAECFREIDMVLHDEAIAHTMKYIDNAIFAIILALILNFLFAFGMVKKNASSKKLMEAMVISSVISDTKVTKGKVSKRYSPVKSSSGGGGGGSSGGGGGGGGGFSGGSSSHGF